MNPLPIYILTGTLEDTSISMFMYLWHSLGHFYFDGAGDHRVCDSLASTQVTQAVKVLQYCQVLKDLGFRGNKLLKRAGHLCSKHWLGSLPWIPIWHPLAKSHCHFLPEALSILDCMFVIPVKPMRGGRLLSFKLEIQLKIRIGNFF